MRHAQMGSAVSGAPKPFAINFEAASAGVPGAGARKDAKHRVVLEVIMGNGEAIAHIVLAPTGYSFVCCETLTPGTGAPPIQAKCSGQQ